MTETRTKYCSNCKELLEWEATYCKYCGAGRRTEPEPAAAEPPPPRKQLLTTKQMVIGMVVLGLAVGGLALKRHLDDKADTITQLEGERETLGDRVQDLTEQKAKALEAGLDWKQQAREKEAAGKLTEADRCTAEADRLLEEAAQLGRQLEEAERELRAVNDELGALGH